MRRVVLVAALALGLVQPALAQDRLTVFLHGFNSNAGTLVGHGVPAAGPPANRCGTSRVAVARAVRRAGQAAQRPGEQRRQRRPTWWSWATATAGWSRVN